MLYLSVDSLVRYTVVTKRFRFLISVNMLVFASLLVVLLYIGFCSGGVGLLNLSVDMLVMCTFGNP